MCPGVAGVLAQYPPARFPRVSQHPGTMYPGYPTPAQVVAYSLGPVSSTMLKLPVPRFPVPHALAVRCLPPLWVPPRCGFTSVHEPTSYIHPNTKNTTLVYTQHHSRKGETARPRTAVRGGGRRGIPAAPARARQIADSATQNLCTLGKPATQSNQHVV